MFATVLLGYLRVWWISYGFSYGFRLFPTRWCPHSYKLVYKPWQVYMYEGLWGITLYEFPMISLLYQDFQRWSSTSWAVPSCWPCCCRWAPAVPLPGEEIKSEGGWRTIPKGSPDDFMVILCGSSWETNWLANLVISPLAWWTAPRP